MAKKSEKPDRELYWHEHSHRWKKSIGGKTFYFGGKCAGRDNDEPGYQRALEAYYIKRGELLKERQEAARKVTPTPPAPFTDRVAALVETLRSGGLDEATMAKVVAAMLREAERQPEEQPATTATKTDSIEGAISEYLEERLTTAETRGQGLSLGQWKADKYKLETFLAFCRAKGISRLVDLTGDILKEYQRDQLQQLRDNTISTVTGHKRLSTVKKWFNWLDDNEYIDSVPKNLARNFSIKIGKPNPKTFTVEEVRTLFKAADDRMRCWIALAVNCAYLQSDLASLTHEMVDLEAGVIKRDRHKTGNDTQHKLWPVTIALLKRNLAPANSEFALLTARGKPLFSERITESGNYSKADNVASVFRDLCDKLGFEGHKRQFKLFRKTSANLLKQLDKGSEHNVKPFLGHVNKAMTAHYTTDTWDAIHEATDRLDEIYHLSDLLEKENGD